MSPIFQASTLAVEADQKPKVIMTNRTHNAVILSFDPFSPSPDYSHGYVASWRRLGDLAWRMGGQETRDTVMMSTLSRHLSDIFYLCRTRLASSLRT